MRCGWEWAYVEICPSCAETLQQWQFGRLRQAAFGTLRLGDDGFIADYSHPNERRWRLRELPLSMEFLNEAGAVTTCYSSFALSRNGRIRHIPGQSR